MHIPVLYNYTFRTVHPFGIPLLPFVQLDIDDALANVPFDATPTTQLTVQEFADMSVARHLM